MKKKIAFVIPWYGEKISGGAEMECKSVAEHLKGTGIEVEILTTCVKDFSSDWGKNYYCEGIQIINDIPVRRFEVDKRDARAFDAVNYKLINHLPITLEEEDVFFKEMVNSTRLYQYIRDNQEEYETFVFIPYMFGTTYYGSMNCPGKAACIPCVHNESYAYMIRMKEMFKRFNKIIFNANPERILAHKIYDLSNAETIVMGLGLDTDFSYLKQRFIEKYGIDKPFILYAGRKDVGKKVDVLLKYFEKFCLQYEDIDLVLIGGGSIDIPDKIKHKVHDLGFVDIQDKYDAYSTAMCLCQPSSNESFSIVIMESWIAGRPVLVNEKCEVTTDFAKRSCGGLYFNSYEEFKECILLFYQNQELSNRMGEKGKKFVQDHFTWDIITKKYKEFLLDNNE